MIRGDIREKPFEKKSFVTLQIFLIKKKIDLPVISSLLKGCTALQGISAGNRVVITVVVNIVVVVVIITESAPAAVWVVVVVVIVHVVAVVIVHVVSVVIVHAVSVVVVHVVSVVIIVTAHTAIWGHPVVWVAAVLVVHSC